MTAKISSRYARCQFQTVDSAGNMINTGKTVYINRRTDGGSNPIWREYIRKGWDATNTLSATYERLTQSNGGHFGKRKNWYIDAQGHLAFTVQSFNWHGYRAGYNGAFLDPDGSLETVADARARSNFNKKMRSFSNAMQGGVFLGELREARDMLRHPAQSLFDGLGKYLSSVNKRSRGAGKKLKTISKIASETWLEYSFGWVPLAGDIADAFTALDNLQNEVRFVKISGGGQAQTSLPDSIDTFTEFGYLKSQRINRKVFDCHVRYKGAIKIEPQVGSTAVLKNWGIHTSQFIPVAWELLPWSFLADYFTNIGDILNFDPSLKSQLVWCCRGVKNRGILTHIINLDHAGTMALMGTDGISSSGSSSFAIYERSSVGRTKSNGGADLSFSDFNISMPDSPNQWLNMAALLGSANSTYAQKFNRF